MIFHSILGRGDVAFALAASTAVLLTAQQDLWLRSEATESPEAGRGLARVAEPFGNSGVVLGSLLGGYALARLCHQRPAEAGLSEITTSVVAAGAEALLIKQVTGRSRPANAPTDIDEFRPFSGNQSFPSGHATVAFATAEAIDLTWKSRWAPLITYPAAALVGWSRVHDDRHWASDVVAGAALGAWTARTVHRIRSNASAESHRLGFEWILSGDGPGVALTLR